MNCEQIEQELPAFLGDELAPEIKATVEKHLSICEKCKAELNIFKMVIEGAKAAEELDPSPDFLNKTQKSLSLINRKSKVNSRRYPKTNQTPWERIKSSIFRPAFATSILLHVAALVVFAFIIFSVSKVYKTPDDSITLLQTHEISTSNRLNPIKFAESKFSDSTINLIGFVPDGTSWISADSKLRFIKVLPETYFQGDERKILTGIPVSVQNGKISLPQKLIDNVFGSERSVALLRHADRTEIWPTSKYNEFKNQYAQTKFLNVKIATINLIAY